MSASPGVELAGMGTMRHKLMLQESSKRFNSSELLRASGDDSDSAYLLRLIGFELLLKVVVERSINSHVHGHNYQDLFNKISQQEQENILRIANERIGLSALSSNHIGVLTDLGSNFVKLRYPHEKYGHMTQEQYTQAGVSWIAAGANTADADYRYHPEELFGLTFALQQIANSS
jgi:HEPN domain-containing protein